ncbi:MAG: methyltransferase [Candidatus Doudnabacteria bacterium]|nr:methyltransferase [Candidatus Doudnabacteria bacterium]
MPADPETVNSYDQQAAKWAKRQREGSSIAHQYLEKPAIYAKLPDLTGKSVLCLGSGSGEECDYLMKLGAAKVVGVDVSKGLIEQAKYAYPDVQFEVMDIERLDFEKNSFDFVYSSLVLHYVQDWQNVLKPLYHILKNDGKFLFSTHHPIKWGAEVSQDQNQRKTLIGFSRSEDESFKIYGDYLNSRMITENLIDKLKVSYYHKPFAEIFSEIRSSGFEIIDMLEPKAEIGAKNERLSFYEIHQKIPLFVIFELAKKVLN